MVRATAAEVVKLFGGSYPAGWDATSVGNICTQVDEEIDAKAQPSSLSTSDTQVVFFANMLTYRRVIHGIWASSDQSTPEPVVWTQELYEWFDRLLTDTTHDAITTVKMQDDS